MEQPHLSDIEVKDVDHLGLIAGIVDAIGLEAIINQLLGQHPQEEVSAGVVVKALILNCFGFLGGPLYLFSQFFESKAVEHLLGEGVKAEFLNDSRIGRVLDQLYQYGLSRLFAEIALKAAQTFRVDGKRIHIDGSSLSVQGAYLSEDSSESQTSDSILPLDNDSSTKGEIATGEPVPIRITHGYSRDNRPDLK